ncbi:MAG: hypothetical protein QNJ53_11840 [Pleurocapsa sp. MO_192.B19]|nr:hypothetical protein [Pleurocapsa sp. MO_192.B19]
MINIILCLVIFLYSFFYSGIQPAKARQVKPEPPTPTATITCFSGGREILRKKIISGPFADEYKFAHEVKVKDETGEHSLNFAGGLCIIDRGEVVPKELALTDKLSCYSGANEIVTFDVYGRETTVDEYVEGRTFFAKATGNDFDANSLHEYLVFGGGACIGSETS